VQAAERPFFFGQQFFCINSFPKPKNYAIVSASSEKGRPVARRVFSKAENERKNSHLKFVEYAPVHNLRRELKADKIFLFGFLLTH
jgi:hypothetical protein